MARVAGIDLPRNKRLQFALPYIYGIGATTAGVICEAANIDSSKKTDELTEEEVLRLRAVIEKNYRVESDLRREVTGNIKRLMDLGNYRGIRHRRGLPCRGQRTSTNARTRKGKKKGPIRGANRPGK